MACFIESRVKGGSLISRRWLGLNKFQHEFSSVGEASRVSLPQAPQTQCSHRLSKLGRLPHPLLVRAPGQTGLEKPRQTSDFTRAPGSAAQECWHPAGSAHLCRCDMTGLVRLAAVAGVLRRSLYVR